MNDNGESRVSKGSNAEHKNLLSAPQLQELKRARRAARVVGFFLPLAITVLGALTQILWMPRMPDPAPTHWNIGGVADGFGSPWTNAIGIFLVSLVLTAMSLLQGVQSLQKPGSAVWGASNRAFPSIILGAVTVVQLGVLLSLVPQLDMADARDAAPAPWAMPIGFGIGIAAGLAAYFLQPRVRIERPIEDDSEPLPLEESERGFWFGEVRPSKGLVWLIFGTLAVIAASLVLMYATGTPGWWGMAVLLLVLAVLFAATCWFRVRIDETGLEARSIMGWPTVRVPATDIARVAAVEISPFAEFGGLGMRWVPGKFGIVMRTGEGIAVTRKSGRDFAITVDDAETGAALLAAAAKAAAKLPEKGEKK
ncbi:DUF1648 domain-containing protein [Leucobacter viscericola]|uniref:DUF1648 domain-containing protein n=1 Tax=Leucobacter viscericola TaxID=2714935 RepID=A0A6G7XEM3_9MICO|nr:DUF1648 domain-containing protein [Leucobacter viscericola]QIK62821.1 DUF1648 domain-containing protein [Leucobacter viscericola]